MKTHELIDDALNYAVAKAEGRALDIPENASDRDLEGRPIPFKLYGTTCTISGHKHHWAVEEITVTRFDVDRRARATAKSISFTDEHGREARGSASMFYLTREDAQLDADLDNFGGLEGFAPSTNWAQGGPIIEREGICLYRTGQMVMRNNQLRWKANLLIGADTNPPPRMGYVANGPTTLIAAMRCFVAAKLGDEVYIPEGL